MPIYITDTYTFFQDTVTVTHAKMVLSVKLGALGFTVSVIQVSMGNIVKKVIEAKSWNYEPCMVP